MCLSSSQHIIFVQELCHSNFAHIAQSNTVDTMKLIQVISLVILAAASANARGTEVLKAFSPRSTITCPVPPDCAAQPPSNCPPGRWPYRYNNQLQHGDSKYTFINLTRINLYVFSAIEMSASCCKFCHSSFAQIIQSNAVDTMKLIQVISFTILAAASANARGTEVLKALSPRITIGCPVPPGCATQQPSSCPSGQFAYQWNDGCWQCCYNDD
ncbi:hypothetical protein P692DRAFT_201802294 [Suillus brevipes Sb2]|nr:hypothetical protein P692DRAFT_201802294 [Suillus brevipes Sb2]